MFSKDDTLEITGLMVTAGSQPWVTVVPGY